MSMDLDNMQRGVALRIEAFEGMLAHLDLDLHDSAAVLFAAAAIGFIAAFPVSYLIALRLRA